MKQTIFTGSAVALVTPMNRDLSVNYEKFEELIAHHLAQKTDALVIAGTTGEGSTLTDQERFALISIAKRCVNGRIPIIAGAGSNNTARAVYCSREAERAGADALLHVTPYYNKASQQGLYLHYKTIAKATELPVILYNVPSRTGVNIAIETYERLSRIHNIVATKEASGNFSQIAKIASVCGDNLDIYSGNDDQITSALALGAKGVISVLANVVPAQVHAICASFFRGNVRKSDEIQLKYLSLIEALFSDVNPIPVKQALNDMGFETGSCRLPLCDMDDIKAEHLRVTLKRCGLLPEGTQNSQIGTVTVQRTPSIAFSRVNI